MPDWRQLAKKGKTSFVGGASDGIYGVAAFDFASVHDPLTARKSWFFFDNEVVCLGAAIHAGSASSVLTTLNQCLLHGQVMIGTAKKTTTLQPGMHKPGAVSWVYHDSVAYIFPTPAEVNISNEEATGNWREITHQAWATTETVKKDVFTLWLDHGIQPQDASYAWIVLPNVGPASAAAYSKHPPVKILSNTEDIQAVQQLDLHRTGIVFYKAGSIRVNDKLTVAASSPCIVMIKANEDKISGISVADPTQALDKLQLKVNERTIDVPLPTGDKAGSTVSL
jgi:chondroitin AC lyase